jgi:hypothetical protein
VRQDLQQAEQQQPEQQPQPQPKVWQDHQQPAQQQPEQQLQPQLRQEDQQSRQQQLEQQHQHQQQLDMLRHQEPDSSSEATDTAEDIVPAGPESSSSQQSAAEHGVAAAGSSTAFVEQQADGQQQQSDGAEGWDNSDDWEPDLSALHTAGSFERKSQQRQVQQASSASTAGRSSFSKADRSSDWRRPSSSAGSRPSSQPRGRGDSKCGAASDADSDSGWELAGARAYGRPGLEADMLINLAGSSACQPRCFCTAIAAAAPKHAVVIAGSGRQNCKELRAHEVLAPVASHRVGQQRWSDQQALHYLAAAV